MSEHAILREVFGDYADAVRDEMRRYLAKNRDRVDTDDVLQELALWGLEKRATLTGKSKSYVRRAVRDRLFNILRDSDNQRGASHWEQRRVTTETGKKTRAWVQAPAQRIDGGDVTSPRVASLDQLTESRSDLVVLGYLPGFGNDPLRGSEEDSQDEILVKFPDMAAGAQRAPLAA